MSEPFQSESAEMRAVRNKLDRDQIRLFKRYFQTYTKGINSGMCFNDDATLFLSNETKLICHIAGHLYHCHFITAMQFINVYEELYGSLTILHASFFSISRGNARDSIFDSWLRRNFGTTRLYRYRDLYTRTFPEWKPDDEI